MRAGFEPGTLPTQSEIATPNEPYNLKSISKISMCKIPKFHTVPGFLHRTVIDKEGTNHPRKRRRRRFFFVHLMSFSDLYSALKTSMVVPDID